MKPARFAYHRVEKLRDVQELLHEFGEDAKILAGGQSLMPLLNMRLVRPRHLLDLNRLGDLEFIREAGAAIEVGALTRHRAVETSPLLEATCPLLPAAATRIGHLAIRNRGTMGGSLCHADPSAELPVAALALGATLVIQTLDGPREIPAERFFTGPLTTCLGGTDLLVHARFPRRAGRWGWAFLEMARRTGDFAVVAVAVVLVLDGAGRIESLRVALGGLGMASLAPDGVVALLIGTEPTPERLSEAGRALGAAVDPPSDVHASGAYRRSLLKSMFPTAVAEAVRRARGDGEDG